MTTSSSLQTLDDLLSARAVGALELHEQEVLEDGLKSLGLGPFVCAADVTVSELHLAMVESRGMMEMPASVQARLISRINGATSSAIASQVVEPKTSFRLGWVAMAAAILLAGLAWWPRLASTWKTAPTHEVVDRMPGTVRWAWTDWDNPEIGGVTGEVVWNEKSQSGYVKFRSLPRNDPKSERYQLWIIDERGMEQRISGAIFDSTGSEVIVPIDPAISVNKAAAFAVTIERPEGVWVSDMKRRVTIAAAPESKT
jgi:anti-sigma-K factor RskA